MTVCEKCWSDAYLKMLVTGESQYDCYKELLTWREDNPCSLKEQQGIEELTDTPDPREVE